MRARPCLRSAGIVMALTALLGVVAPAAAQEVEPKPDYPRPRSGLDPRPRGPAEPTLPSAPEPTDRGAWDGTWFYVSRDVQAALWLRTVDGRPQVMLQYFHLSSLEGFKTDWNGHAEYFVKGDRGTFDMEILDGGPDRIDARWTWELRRAASTRHETAEIELYRTGDGRGLVLVFLDNERVLIGKQGTEHELPPRQFWSFRKVSSGEALWEELPF